MAHMGLLPLEKGFSSDYDENLNPSIVNEFATAAFRFGHSNIEGRIAYVLSLLSTEIFDKYLTITILPV